MLKKNVCAVSGRETDVCSHGLWACLWCLGLAEALLSGKQVDVACLVSSKGVIWLQGKPWCALGVLLSLSSVTSAPELPWLTRWSRAGFAFWGHVLTGCWGFFFCMHSGIYCCGRSWEKPPPELMVSTEHPAPQVSRGSPANRDVPLITVISAAPLPRSALSCSSRHSPATLVGMI